MGDMKRRDSKGEVVLCHDHDKARLEALVRMGGCVVGWVDGFYRIAPPRTAVRGHQTAHSAPNADSAGK